ncbi:MAG: glycosyltransferase family 4 protein [Acidobacteriota bacterium]
MRLLYLSLSYVPSRRASSVHVMKMCAALSRAGHQVELVTKRSAARQEPGVDDPFAFYGVATGFRLTSLPRPAWRGGGLLWAAAQEALLRRRRGTVDLVYARDPGGARIAARLGMPLIFEAHNVPSGRALDRLRRLVAAPSLRRLVVISAALRGLLAEVDALPVGERTLVAHDAADPPPEPHEKSEGGRLQVGYVGHLYPGRGIEIVAELATRLPQADFHVVGGRPQDVAAWQSRAERPNLTFHGFVPPGRLAAHYRRFDLLLMPYQHRVAVASGGSDTAAYMSPMKMFEYMATGTAIVSSDLPVLREVLTDGDDAVLVPADEPNAWEAAVRRLADDAEERRRLGRRAREHLLSHHTWDARARQVLDGL